MRSMINHKKLFLGLGAFLLVLGIAFFHTPRVHAQGPAGTTAVGTITEYNTNWGQNGTVVNTTAPFINPGNCPSTDAYQTDPTNPSVQTSALLGALLSGKRVQIAIQGCSGGRPMILGVSVIP